MIATYDQLAAAIADWLNRADLAPVIPTFVALAEADFNRRLRVRQMIKRATQEIATNVFSLPCGWLEAVNVQINGNPVSRLVPASPAQIDDLDAGSVPGTPAIYTVFGEQMQVSPHPAQVMTIEMLFYAEVPSLGPAAQTSWLLTLAPDLYLYGALVQSAPYLRDDARMGVWGEMREKLIADLNLQDERASYSGGTPRMSMRGYR